MIRNIVRIDTRTAVLGLPVFLAVLASAAEGATGPVLETTPVPNLQDAAAFRRPTTQAGPPEMTIAEARALFQRSGMGMDELRRRLEVEGLDASVADMFLPASPAAGTAESRLLTAEVMETLVRVGLVVDDAETESTASPERAALPAEEPEEIPTGIRDLGADLDVFGRQVFRGVRGAPVLSAPAGEDYVLGPGDRLSLVITGDVELVHTLYVTREGTTFIPRAGNMVVSGLTLAEFETRLGGRLRDIYSGIGRDPEARTRYSVSLGRVRTIQVHVVGAVHAPGSYVVSSMASLVDAMYRSGGPILQGSFRHVRIVRGNEETEVDLYPFMTSGRLDVNPRLREGDIVHVPWAGKQVAVRGMIRQPAIYELREGEGIPELVEFAGGLLPTARTETASVDRVLPPHERSPLTERVKLILPLSSVLAGEDHFAVEAGDRIEILRVSDATRREFVVGGAVGAPGTYGWTPDLTMGDAIELAGGAEQEALLTDVLVVREDPSERAVLRRIRVDLTTDLHMPVAEDDRITVFSRVVLRQSDSVSIRGAVAAPGQYLFVDGMTPGDLVLEAGGFLASAMPWEVEVARRVETDDASDDAESIISGIRASVVETSRAAQFAPPADDASRVVAEATLQAGDVVYVRRRAGFSPLATVVLEGQFMHTGEYAMVSPDETLSSVMARAGGVTSPLITDIRLERGDVVVAVDISGLRQGRSRADDPVLQEGDVLIAEPYRSTVAVVGEIEFPTEVTFRPGLSVSDVISEAGGVRDSGDRDGLSVSYRDGSRATTSKFLGLFRSDPLLEPGARVFVPSRPEETGSGFDWAAFSSLMLAFASTVATMILAINSGGGGGGN